MADTPITHRSLDTGHGRITTRTIQVLPAPTDPPFPDANQVFPIERHVAGRKGKPASAALGVASPGPGQAS